MSAKRAVVKCKMCRHLYRPLRVVKCNFDDDDDDDEDGTVVGQWFFGCVVYTVFLCILNFSNV